MPRYLLRVEAVNLGHIIDDTDDLSTRRGGGLLALFAVESALAGVPTQLNPVATGASIGLYWFDATDDDAAERVRAASAAHFRDATLPDDGPELRHATFVADVVPTGDSPADQDLAVQRVVAANRWRQLREPSVSQADIWAEAGEPCTLDFVRPGSVRGRLPERPNAPLSPSVAARRGYGRSARQRFYTNTLGSRPGHDFTDKFEQIARRGDLPPDRAPPNTDNKLAVLYLDGNRFGRRGREVTEKCGLAGLTAWSEGLKKHHAKLLRSLIERCEADDSWRTTDGDRSLIRLETLLWGGDEIIWVVPAWKGWEMVEWFFGQDHTVDIGSDSIPVTYAAGLVFCNAKAPIKNVIGLAHRLGDAAKDAAKKINKDALPHRLAYEVLESIDDVQGDLDDYRRKWLPAGYDPAGLTLDAARPQSFWDAVRSVAGADDFPMRQLYAAGRAWRAGEPLDRPKERMDKSKSRDALDAVRSEFLDPGLAYLHLLQMLPYTPTHGAA